MTALRACALTLHCSVFSPVRVPKGLLWGIWMGNAKKTLLQGSRQGTSPLGFQAEISGRE